MGMSNNSHIWDAHAHGSNKNIIHTWVARVSYHAAGGQENDGSSGEQDKGGGGQQQNKEKEEQHLRDDVQTTSPRARYPQEGAINNTKGKSGVG